MLVTIAGIFGLIGFIIWDRYSTLCPMDMRLHRLEENLDMIWSYSCQKVQN